MSIKRPNGTERFRTRLRTRPTARRSIASICTTRAIQKCDGIAARSRRVSRLDGSALETARNQDETGVDPGFGLLSAHVCMTEFAPRDPKGSQARLEPLPGIHQSLRILNPTSRIESITAGVSRRGMRARAPNPRTKRARNDNTIKPTRARARLCRLNKNLTTYLHHTRRQSHSSIHSRERPPEESNRMNRIDRIRLN